MTRLKFIICTALLLLCFFLSMIVGAVDIPVGEVLRILWDTISSSSSREGSGVGSYIVLNSRLPQAITAIFCGASLSVSGLMLQTAFRNPLAGPSIFGISSGASLGVALVMLSPLSLGLVGGGLSIIIAAFVGAMVVMALILFFSTLVKNDVMLLIIGIMIGYIANSAISLLNFFATDSGVQSYMVWGLGNFGGVTLQQLPLFMIVSLLGIIAALLLIKPLNALLLGEQYAENLGVNIRLTRFLLLLVTGILTAIATAFCGPIAFIGLAVPHIARMVIGTENHRQLLPMTILMGALVTLLCSIISVLPGEAGIIPLNAVTPLIGAPVIIYVVMRGRTR